VGERLAHTRGGVLLDYVIQKRKKKKSGPRGKENPKKINTRRKSESVTGHKKGRALWLYGKRGNRKVGKRGEKGISRRKPLKGAETLRRAKKGDHVKEGKSTNSRESLVPEKGRVQPGGGGAKIYTKLKGITNTAQGFFP